ncbi:hypothetical protein [Paenibacillus chungangensis]|uniref:Tail length tape measure protein n=1 Tax=Paenibacillus chungangensis TaxID=696535 RepID=A0ABW3HQL1_9BACL
MSTTMAIQQQGLISMLQGMSGSMSLAERATEGLKQAMNVMEQRTAATFYGMKNPMHEIEQSASWVSAQFTALNHSLNMSMKSAENYAKTLEYMRNLEKLTVTDKPAGGSANSKTTEKDKLQDKIKKDALPAMERMVDLIAFNLNSLNFGFEQPDPAQKDKGECCCPEQGNNSLPPFNKAPLSPEFMAQVPPDLEKQATKLVQQPSFRKNGIIIPGSLPDAAANVVSNDASEMKLPNLSDLLGNMTTGFAGLTQELKSNAAAMNFLSNNWSVFGSLSDGVSMALTAYNTMQFISQLYTAMTAVAMIATIGLKNAWQQMNTAMKANVIMLIISLVIGLGYALYSLWEKNDKFAIGLMRAWHGILNFFANIPVFFWTIVEDILKAFLVWANSVGKLYDSVINGIIKGLNTVLNAINKVTGSSLQISAKFSFSDITKDVLSTVQSNKADAVKNALDVAAENDKKLKKFMDDRADKKKKNEVPTSSALENMSPDQLSKLTMNNNLTAGFDQSHTPASGNLNSVGRVGEVGKINDTVDISSEDLKTMRELAEMKNIQNFVTLQPSVNVQTGDIRHDLDVSSMVAAITTVLQDEIAVSAEGVYR